MLRHCIAPRARGMVAVGDDAGGLMIHSGTISVKRVKECVFAFGGRVNEGYAVAEGVKFPIISMVVLHSRSNQENMGGLMRSHCGI